MSKGYTYKINKGKDGDVEIDITVDKEKFVDAKAKTFTRLSSEIEVPGFRKGKGPENLVEAKLGTKLYEETINRLIPDITADIVEEEKLNPITNMDYQIKKVAESEGLEFSATFVNFPEFELGDFSKIKIKEEDAEVTEADINNSIKRLLELNKQQEDLKKQAEEKSSEEDSADDKKSDNADKAKAKKSDKKEEKQEDLMEKAKNITDEEVKEMGIGFNTVDELRKELKERLKADKERMAENVKLGKMLEEAVKLSKIKLPEKLIEQEIESRISDYKSRVDELGIKLEDFLKSQNTTEEELRKQWHDEISQRLAQELLFVKISQEHDLKVTPTEVEAEIQGIMDPKMKKEYDNDKGRRYISAVILQQKAALWLREQVEGPQDAKETSDSKDGEAADKK